MSDPREIDYLTELAKVIGKYPLDEVEFSSVDDSGDLTPYDFRDLERKARYNALPDDIKECLGVMGSEVHWRTDQSNLTIEWFDAAQWQLLDYLGAL